MSQSTTFQGRGDHRAAFTASMPTRTEKKAIQCLYAASLMEATQTCLLQPPDQQPFDLPRMSPTSGDTVPRQCIFALSFGQIHVTIFYVVIGMDVIHLLLGFPWQSYRRVLPEGYLNTTVFTYHG